jgi:hypothetical protein
MKRIKYFEMSSTDYYTSSKNNFNPKGISVEKYWSVNLRDPYLPLKIKIFSQLYQLSDSKKNAIIYFAKNNPNDVRNIYFSSEEYGNWCSFTKSGMVGDYQGEIEITPEDIKQFEFEKETDKYNL